MIGLDMKLYMNTGSYASPTWTLVKNVIDLKFDPGTAAEVQAKTRGDGTDDHDQWEPGLKAASYEWGMRWKKNDTELQAFVDAWKNRDMVELAFADGPIATAGTTFWRQECKIFGIPRDEPLGESVVITVTAKPCASDNPPVLTTVAA